MKNDLCLIGLGHIGLPTAALFAQAGLSVVGADINLRIVDLVNRGESPIEEPGLSELIGSVTAGGRLRAASAPEPADAFLIAVGTPVGTGNRPDLAYVQSAAEAVSRVLAPGNLVILESTVPPGTTLGIVKEVLERTSGLTAGRDFHLAHCAERAIPGVTLKEIVANDRLVGGIDAASTARALTLYARLVKGALIETDATTSEIVKLVENTYRDINIAFANELARLCESLGTDVWKVIGHANKHPRVHVHQPGPGVGGHCIPVVPWFLVAADSKEMPLIQLARQLNDDQMLHVAARALALVDGSPKPARVAVLGLAYKSGTSDSRETPAVPIIKRLTEAGAEVQASDPHVERFSQPVLSVDDALAGADLLLILTDDKDYAKLDPHTAGARMRTRIVYDTRNIIDATAWTRAGFTVHTLGVGQLQTRLPATAPHINGYKKVATLSAGERIS